MPNTLYYGDNLDILRRYIADESVDLVYLDPPFNSNASYNVLFNERTGEESPAQIKAFTDTWEWTQETERTYEQDIILHPGTPSAVKDMMAAFRQFIGRNAMMAYLVMMTPRLVELRRALKPTGSLYLHCDPTASHYLKIVLDTVFGKDNFRNEVTWQRTGAHSDARRYGSVSDHLLFFTRSKQWTWNEQHTPYSDEYVKERYRYDDGDGRLYWRNTMTAPSHGRPVTAMWFRGVEREPPSGTMWRFTQEQIDELEKRGRIYYSSSGMPYVKSYLDERKGRPLQNIWTDVPMSKSGYERLGYPTQKPLALLERIIEASSNEGDVVLDPFCGCGTAVAAAEKLKRQWIGIDLTHLAVALMKSRLKTAFGLEPGRDYEVVGEPQDAGSARALWEQDPYQFQFWAVSLLQGQPQPDQKKGADGGIDGVLHFIDGPKRTAHRIIIQVKGGNVSVSQVRDLKGVVEREKAALGLFISLDEPTAPMRTEAASGGFFHSELWQQDYPKIQLRTIPEMLAGHGFDLPPHPSMYQAAQRVTRTEGVQGELVPGPDAGSLPEGPAE